jgi:glyoxylase-like metal-dependent hydrolase (beta-lactamase superfamily II)
VSGEPGERLRRGGLLRKLQLSEDTRLVVLPDGVSPLSPAFLMSAPADYWRAHPEYLDRNGHLVTSVGGLLVQRGDRALLIDAGYGDRPGGSPPVVAPWHGGQLPTSLRQAGVDPDRIEAVAFTHLHDDHIGWASPYSPVRGGTLLTDAEWLVTAPEWQANRTDAQGTVRLTDAETRVRTIADGEEVFPGVTAVIAAGHSRGHTAYVIDSGDRWVVVLGDAVHSPSQVDHPEWTVRFDSDGAAAEASRRRLLDLAAGATLAYAGHFADVQFGHVERSGTGTTWRPAGPEPLEFGRHASTRPGGLRRS